MFQNPEAIIAATIAAKSAEFASNQVYWMVLAILIILLIMGAMLMWFVYKLEKLNQIGQRLLEHAGAERSAKEKS